MAARRGGTRRQREAGLTGLEAPFSTLSLRRSADPVLSMAWELHGWMVTLKWKMLVWLARARAAQGRRFRRPCRWLAKMHGHEAARVWGHMGAAAQYLKGDQGPPLYR